MSPVTRTGALSRATVFIGIAITVVATLLALVGPQISSASAATPSLQAMTQRVIDDTNAIRYQQGLLGLARDSRLDQVAQAWAEQQYRNGAMSHNPDYSKQIPAGWQRAGENVAKGYTYTQVVEAWKNSASHYANLVNDYTSVGVGYYEGPDGRRFWSQVFAKYPGTVQPTAPAAATPAPAPASTPAPTASATPAPAAPASSTASPAAEPAAPAGTAIALSSPSFESGLGAWSAPSGKVDGPNSSARGGTKSLLVPGASNRLVTQNVTTTVNAGSSHTLVVYVRADANAAGSVRLRTVGGSSTEVATVDFSASAAGWLKVPVTLTAKTAHTGFTIEIVTSTSGRTYRIDSVSLTRTAEGTPAAATPAPAPAPAASSPAPAPAAPAPAPAPATPAPAAPSPTPTPTPAPTPSSKPIITIGGIRIG